MPTLAVVSTRPADTATVYFGAQVELEDAAGQSRGVRIVGADEADPARGWISLDSPVARSLLGRHVDDEVVLGEQGRFAITAIAYPDPQA